MSGNTFSCLVPITRSSGVELNVHLVLARKLTRQEQKLKTLSQYVEQYPSGWKKRWELANLLSVTGNWERAVQEYCQVIKRQPQLIDARLKLGKLLQLMGREAEAIEVYESALPLSDNEAAKQYISGAIAICQGDSKKATAAFENAANLQPNNAAYWLVLGQLQVERENPVGALRAFDAILSLNSDDIAALIHSYDALRAVGNLQEAQRRLHKLTVLAGDDFRVLQRQLNERCAMRLVSGKEGKETKKMIVSALRQYPHGAEAHKALAYYHIFRGDWPEGVEVLAEFAAKHPNHHHGWYYYGRCLFDTGEYQKAASAMLKAYHLYPDECEIYRALCEILPAAKMTSIPLTFPLKKRGGGTLKIGEGDKITLTSIVEEMLERFPQRWSVWATAGRVLVESLKEVERGCRVSQQGTKLQPQLADAWFCHGRVLALAGKHDEAVEALEKGWHILPAGGYMQSVPAAVWLAQSYRALGDVGTSKRWWETACEECRELKAFNPTVADYWLGRTLVGLGDRLGAVNAYESALSQQLLYPARGEVEKILRRLKSKGRKDFRGRR
ncbi:MAG: tetratricopeptide repeat protein (plasmid) [Microcoleus anatoxicus]|uniref:tetratricopeptide repeat protein n=1 Tax=Microcoleus anatoxicus TaxID=2705319 RepID=UPI003672F4E7